MRLLPFAATAAILLPLIILQTGCDSGPGVTEVGGSPPMVTELTLAPDVVILEELPPSQVIGDSIVVIEVAIDSRVIDDDGDIDSVAYIINSPFEAFEPIHSGLLNRIGNGSRFTGTARFSTPRGNTGLYTLVVYAVDSEVSVSNQARGLIEYRLLEGNPPEIVSVEGPDSITPPATFSFVAIVRDAEGLGNIARVETLAPNGATFELFDDGRSGGDLLAGDGRYTVSFTAPEGTAPGTVQFRFKAIDRQGLESEVVVKEVTIN